MFNKLRQLENERHATVLSIVGALESHLCKSVTGPEPEPDLQPQPDPVPEPPVNWMERGIAAVQAGDISQGYKDTVCKHWREILKDAPCNSNSDVRRLSEYLVGWCNTQVKSDTYRKTYMGEISTVFKWMQVKCDSTFTDAHQTLREQIDAKQDYKTKSESWKI